MTPLVIGAGAAVASAVLVGLVRRHAVRVELLDHPSDRSSHDRPTPRGGGLGVIVAAISAILAGSSRLPPPFVAALAGIIVVAVVGWQDDRTSLSARTRILVHLMAGAGVAWFASATPGPLGVTGGLAVLWWLFWSVAAINVTNFMDGIDGLIGAQMLVWGCHLVLLCGGSWPGTAIGASLAGASAGFLLWNWAPARIFLGDVGSGSLGLLAVMGGVAAMNASGWPLEAVFLPLLPMFLDATVTLFRRYRRGMRLWDAHREHLYQRLARSSGSHARVSLAFAVLAGLGAVAAHLAMQGVWIAPAVYTAVVLVIGWIVEQRLRRVAPSEGANDPSP